MLTIEPAAAAVVDLSVAAVVTGTFFIVPDDEAGIPPAVGVGGASECNRLFGVAGVTAAELLDP